MEELFELPVVYKGEEILLPAKLVQQGYTHKFEVEVSRHRFLFEPDEERNYRIIAPEQQEVQQVDLELLKATAAALESIMKQEE